MKNVNFNSVLGSDECEKLDKKYADYSIEKVMLGCIIDILWFGRIFGRTFEKNCRIFGFGRISFWPVRQRFGFGRISF